jgi:hypothetical protein
VRTIRRKKARIVSPEEVIINGSKPLGDIVLRISPTAKTPAKSGLANRIQKDCKEASALLDISGGGKGDVKIPSSFTSALSDESGRIGQALSNIGYHVIGIKIENACVAVDGSSPDLRIWVREQESSDAEVVKQNV